MPMNTLSVRCAPICGMCAAMPVMVFMRHRLAAHGNLLSLGLADYVSHQKTGGQIHACQSIGRDWHSNFSIAGSWSPLRLQTYQRLLGERHNMNYMDSFRTRGYIPWNKIENWLRAARSIWISTTRPDRRPHAVPVWFIWDDQHVYFISAHNLQKSKNLAHQ